MLHGTNESKKGQACCIIFPENINILIS
jgi:hypothetical protein